MNRPEQHDPIQDSIEEQLQDMPAPPPPEGWDALAESIKAEIPTHLELAPEVSGTSSEVSGTPRRTVWLAAASVVLAVAAGWVGLQVMEENPDPVAVVEETAQRSAPEAPTEPPVAAKQDAEVDSPATADVADVADVSDAAAEAPALEERQVTRGTSSTELESREDLPAADWDLQSQAPGVLADRMTVEPTPQPPPPPPASARRTPPPPPRPQARVRENEPIEAGNAQVGALREETRRLEQEMYEMEATEDMVTVTSESPLLDAQSAPPSTGGTTEPNDAPYGDVFFEDHGTNPFVDTDEDRLSTFGLDVDTGSWNVARRYLSDGHLPPAAAVRIEEWVNAFDYGDAPPRRPGEDFRLTAQGAPTPFAGRPGTDRHAVLRFAVQAREVLATERSPTDLTFVVDVSGSMAREDRLGLVRRSLQLLTDQLRPDDRVALVVYGSDARLILPHTGDKAAVREAIGRLQPEGSTNAEAGLRLAYRLAASVARPGVTNRVILCSDGVANVGATGPDSILQVIERSANEGGIELLTVGFGMGNYNDVLMEQLANRGDGRYAYVDTFDEARRLFVDDLTGTLFTVASEARAQVAFDPQVVERWRLLGYENRDIADERFRDDTIDAGEIGAGHAVTALYEVKLADDAPRGGTLARLTLRYRSEASGEMTERSVALRRGDLARSFDAAPRPLRLAALVAQTAELTKGTFWTRVDDPEEVARRARRLAAEPGVPRAWREGLDMLVDLAEKVADRRREEERR